MLNVSLEELKTLGTNIDTKADEFNTILENINRVNSNLSLYWQGEDAKKYTETVAEQAEEMKLLYNILKDCSSYILSIV